MATTETTPEITRTVLVKIDSLQTVAGILTGYGEIKGIDHEGTITYNLTGKDAFELGQLSAEIKAEIGAYFNGVEIVSAKGRTRS